MSALGDATDAGLLLAWAARPRETPARHEEYHRVVGRYRDEPEFAALVDALFSGAGLSLVVDQRDGAVVIAGDGSSLRVTAADMMKRAQPAQRAVIGVVLLAIARIAFPDPSMVDDPDRVAVFTTGSVVDALDRAADGFAETSGDGLADSDRVEMWRQWLALAPARPNAQRHTSGDRLGVVNKVCRFLTDVGYLTARGNTDGGTWTARPRFRHAVAAISTDSDLYRMVNQLDMVDLDEEDETK